MLIKGSLGTIKTQIWLTGSDWDSDLAHLAHLDLDFANRTQQSSLWLFATHWGSSGLRFGSFGLSGTQIWLTRVNPRSLALTETQFAHLHIFGKKYLIAVTFSLLCSNALVSAFDFLALVSAFDADIALRSIFAVHRFLFSFAYFFTASAPRLSLCTKFSS